MFIEQTCLFLIETHEFSIFSQSLLLEMDRLDIQLSNLDTSPEIKGHLHQSFLDISTSNIKGHKFLI